MLDEAKFKTPAKLKIVTCLHYVSVVIILVIFATMFIKPADAYEATESYATVEDVKNSRVYYDTIRALKWILTEKEAGNSMVSINSIHWISQETEPNAIYERMSKTYMEVSYNNGAEDITLYLTVSCAAYRNTGYSKGSSWSISEITEKDYVRSKSAWLLETDKEAAAWMREHEYDDFAIGVILEEAR